MDTSAKTLTTHETESCCTSKAFRNAGQNQFVEDSIATSALTAPLSVETVYAQKDIANAIQNLFKSISNREIQSTQLNLLKMDGH